MAWINLTARRYVARERAKTLLNKWESAKRREPLSLLPVLMAVQTGEATLTERAIAVAPRLLELVSGDLSDAELVQPDVLPNIVGLSVVNHIAGIDQSTLWTRIVKAKAPRDPGMRALKSIVARILKPAAPLGIKAEVKVGSVYRESDWTKLVSQAEDPKRLFDLASSPDHPLYHAALLHFVMPLGLLLHRQFDAAGHEAPDIFNLFAFGSNPEAHLAVIYERRQARPEPGSVPDPNDPATWFGFDAIEIIEDRAYAYHYLGLRWQAPLLFQPDANAYGFLDTLDLSWKLVESEVSAKVWTTISKCRDAGACVHILVHDSLKAPAPADDLARAEQHYGVKLETLDFMLA